MEVKGMRLRSIEPELRKAETRRGLHITSSRESIDCVIETHSRCQLPQNKASRVQNIEAPTRLHMACRRPWDKKHDKKIIVRYASQRAHRQRHETPQEPAGKGVESPNEGGPFHLRRACYKTRCSFMRRLLSGAAGLEKEKRGSASIPEALQP